jgi:hypothetical protein
LGTQNEQEKQAEKQTKQAKQSEEFETRAFTQRTRIVHDIFHQATNVTVTLGVVDGAQLGSTLSVMRVRLENCVTALALCTDDATYARAHRQRVDTAALSTLAHEKLFKQNARNNTKLKQ